VIILTLNTVEVVNEQRSKKAIASLRKMAEPMASVNRGGHVTEINVEEVVPGDLVLLQTGRRVPADARLVDTVSLAVDESALTGESLPVEKSTIASLNADAPLAERSNMVYSYTLVTRGKGAALVVSTGMHTEVGRIASIAREVKEPPTPLQTMMDDLSKSLVWFALGFSLLVPLVGFSQLTSRQNRCCSPDCRWLLPPFPKKCRSSSPWFWRLAPIDYRRSTLLSNG